LGFPSIAKKKTRKNDYNCGGEKRRETRLRGKKRSVPSLQNADRKTNPIIAPKGKKGGKE